MYHSLKGLFYHNNLFQIGNTHFNDLLLVYSLVFLCDFPLSVGLSFEISPLIYLSIAYASAHCRDSPFAELCRHCTWKWEFPIKTVWRVHSVLILIIDLQGSLAELTKKKKKRILPIYKSWWPLSLDHSCLIMSQAMTKASGIYSLQIVAINFCAILNYRA